MGIVAGVRHWLRALFTRNRVESEMNREMRFHVDMETERLVSGGVPPDEARRRAMARFGGVERYKEEVRAERGTGWLDAAVIEFRIAWRGLAKRPAFAIVVIVTIAIGVGATTAVYSWANWALFRPVPGVRDPGRMVSVEFLTSPNERGSYSETGISYANFGDLKATVHSFSGLAGYAQQTAQLAVPNADPMELWGALVLGDYFGTLGVVPRLGRAFSPTELVPSASDRVVIISDSIWHLAFGGARDVLGREVRVNGEAFTVIEVAPPGFRGSERSGRDDLWFPGAAYTALAHQHTDLSDRGVGLFMELIGRLRPGVTPELAEQELNRRLDILVSEYPKIDGDYTDAHAVVSPDLGTQIRLRVRVVDAVRLTLAVVGLILLIACANVANLLLLRASRRRGELAVRRALGASARRVLGQHLIEGAVLSLAGGALGLALATALAHLFTSQGMFFTAAYTHFVLDWRVLAVAVAVSVGTGLVFGLAPGVAALRDDPMRQLKEGGERQSVRHTPVRALLTTLQVGAATALVVGALLLARTLHSISQIDLGLDPHNVSTFDIDSRPQGYPPTRIQAIRRELLTRVAALPGIDAAAIASTLPGQGAYMGVGIRTLNDTANRSSISATYFSVSPDLFRVLGIPMLHGATFAAQEFDDSTSRNVVVSRALAQRLLGSANAVGRQFIISGFGSREPRTVIGVAGDVRNYGPLEAPGMAVYVPAGGGALGAFLQSSFSLVVRSARPPDAIRHDVKGILLSAAAGVPLPTAEPLSAMVNQAVSGPRLFARLIGVLALIAVVLAGVGLYSVIAFAVTERTREIGIRMALGATRQTVIGMVARQSAVLVAVGLLIGGGGAYALGRLLSTWLYDVGPLDPMSYAGATIAWAVLAVLASFVPARAAARVDPTIAMRAE